ncbi:hypothetical protein D910_05346 [Dendroctonus ponderosae]
MRGRNCFFRALVDPENAAAKRPAGLSTITPTRACVRTPLCRPPSAETVPEESPTTVLASERFKVALL